MAVNNPYAKYKQNSVETKSPGELTLMLYEGCLKFIKRAEKAIEEKNIEEKNTNLIKAQNIIRELMVTLNTDVAVSGNMMQMYDFIMSKLVDANTHNDLEALKHAEQFVADFRDTWKEVIKLDRQNRHSGGTQAGAGAGGIQRGTGNSSADGGSSAVGSRGAAGSSAGTAQSQAVGKITPEKKAVPAAQVRTEEAAAPVGAVGTGSSAQPAAPGNPYASKAASNNNPYARAKRSAAAAAGVSGNSFRK